jgi:predicted dehydrogenase
MDRLRVGIAGYGIVGNRRRVCVEKNFRMELVAVCDKTFEADGVFNDGIRYYKNYQSLIKEQLDILIVCLPNDIAPNVVIEGIEKGINVFCEKPPGRNVDDIIRVIDCEKRSQNIKLMYGFNHRYHESVKEALKIIQSGKLGSIINMRGVYGKSKLVTFNQSNWRTQRDVAGGGILLDQGIHMVDLMRLFGGEFREVKSFISNQYWGYGVEDNAYAIMRSDTGTVAMIHSSATQWRHRFNLDINLERGSLNLGGILSGTKSYGAETLSVISVQHDKDNGDPMELVTRYNSDPSWEEEINVFAECVMTDKPIFRGSSMDAFNTMKLVYKIYYADPEWRRKYSIENPEEKNYE